MVTKKTLMCHKWISIPGHIRIHHAQLWPSRLQNLGRLQDWEYQKHIHDFDGLKQHLFQVRLKFGQIIIDKWRKWLQACIHIKEHHFITSNICCKPNKNLSDMFYWRTLSNILKFVNWILLMLWLLREQISRLTVTSITITTREML